MDDGELAKADEADLNYDLTVNFSDFALLAEQWLSD
jgi:hypothetical protein